MLSQTLSDPKMLLHRYWYLCTGTQRERDTVWASVPEPAPVCSNLFIKSFTKTEIYEVI
jgi:hypothetical protein